MRIINSRDVTIGGSRPFVGTNTFLRVEGSESANIRLENNDLTHAERKVALGPGVAKDVVQ
jgi:hypothetical protein